MRTGPDSSKSLKYSQEVTSLDDEPERAGRSLVTTSHEVIRQWAEERGGARRPWRAPSTATGSGCCASISASDTASCATSPGTTGSRTFDERRLNFIYQEER